MIELVVALALVAPTATTETMLALSAAPAPLRQRAGFWLRTATGYKHARASRNGFDCIVELETPDSFEPECFDSDSANALIPVIVFRREREALGISSRAVAASVRAGYASGRFRAPRSGDIVFMLSSKNRVFDPDTGRVIPFPRTS